MHWRLPTEPQSWRQAATINRDKVTFFENRDKETVIRGIVRGGRAYKEGRGRGDTDRNGIRPCGRRI